MRTRSAARVINEKEKSKKPELENLKLESVKWVKDGRVINPAFGNPSLETVKKWKAFFESVYNHPNILAHQDAQCVRDLLQLFGAFVKIETKHVLLELDVPSMFFDKLSTYYILQPHRSTTLAEKSLNVLFGEINDFQFVPETNAVLILDFDFAQDAKEALVDLVDFIVSYPECLFFPNFGYIHDFLVKVGVMPEAITYEVYNTQVRRAESKYPASTLLLKLGVPEFIITAKKSIPSPENEDSDNSNDSAFYETDDDEVVQETDQFPGNCFRSGSSSEGDSGVGTYSSISDSGPVANNKSGVILKPFKPENSLTSTKSPTTYKSRRGLPKIYTCPVCNRKYVSKGNCNSHIRKRHPKADVLPGSKEPIPHASFFCPFCKKGFKSPQYVKNHIRKIHPECPQNIPIIRTPLNKSGIKKLNKKLVKMKRKTLAVELFKSKKSSVGPRRTRESRNYTIVVENLEA